MSTKLTTTLTALLAVFLVLMVFFADTMQQSFIFAGAIGAAFAAAWLVEAFLQKTKLGAQFAALCKAASGGVSDAIDSAVPAIQIVAAWAIGLSGLAIVVLLFASGHPALAIFGVFMTFGGLASVFEQESGDEH